MKYVVTYTLKGRRVAKRNGKISYFKTKRAAARRGKEYKGYRPRVAKVKWK